MVASKHSFRLLSKEKVRKIKPSLVPETKTQDTVESDNKKRTFLKVAGMAGAVAAATYLIPKKADALVFGSSPTSGTVAIKDKNNNKINPAQEDGHLAAIDTSTASVATNTAPFVAPMAGGYVQQDGNYTMARESGGNLATVAANSGKFQFDTSSNLKVAVDGTVVAGDVNLRDTTGTRVNPATDDNASSTAMYLRRMVKLMESQGTVDAANRQRITIDGTVTTSASTTITTLAGQGLQMYQDPARTAYATGIRQNLVWPVTTPVQVIS